MKGILLITFLLFVSNLFAKTIDVSCNIYQRKILVTSESMELASGLTLIKELHIKLNENPDLPNNYYGFEDYDFHINNFDQILKTGKLVAEKSDDTPERRWDLAYLKFSVDILLIKDELGNNTYLKMGGQFFRILQDDTENADWLSSADIKLSDFVPELVLNVSDYTNLRKLMGGLSLQCREI